MKAMDTTILTAEREWLHFGVWFVDPFVGFVLCFLISLLVLFCFAFVFVFLFCTLFNLFFLGGSSTKSHRHEDFQ